MKKFNEYNNTDDIDPFNEEDWTEDNNVQADEYKKELVDRCSYDILDNVYNYQDYLLDILREHFNEKSIRELKDFLGVDNDDHV